MTTLANRLQANAAIAPWSQFTIIGAASVSHDVRRRDTHASTPNENQ